MEDRVRGQVPRRIRRTSMVGIVGIAIAFGGGCGSDVRDRETTRYAAERTLFQRHCSACHTLADADAHGTKAGSEANFDVIRPNVSSVENYLDHQIGKMPDVGKVLSRRQRTAIARYVADVDGCGTRLPTACDP